MPNKRTDNDKDLTLIRGLITCLIDIDNRDDIDLTKMEWISKIKDLTEVLYEEYAPLAVIQKEQLLEDIEARRRVLERTDKPVGITEPTVCLKCHFLKEPDEFPNIVKYPGKDDGECVECRR